MPPVAGPGLNVGPRQREGADDIVCQAPPHEHEPHRSPFQWWEALWVLLFASTLVLRLRDSSEAASNPVDGFALFRIGLVGLVALELVLRLPTWIHRISSPGPVGLLFVFALIAAASTAWSVFPAWTLYKSMEYLVDVALLAAIIARLRSTGEVERLFDITLACYGCLLVLASVESLVGYSDVVQRTPRLIPFIVACRFPAISSNGVGNMAAIVAVVTLVRLSCPSNRRLWTYLLFTIALGALAFSQCRSAIAGFGLAVLLVARLGKVVSVLTMALLALVGVILLSPVADVLWLYATKDQPQHLLVTLSSRTVWWEYAFDLLKQRPLLGYGAYAGGQFAVMEQMKIGVIANLHSTWVQLLVDLSIWGLAPIALTLLAVWTRTVRLLTSGALRGRDRLVMLQASGVLAVITVRSIFTVHIVWHAPLWFFLTIICVEHCGRPRELASSVSFQDQENSLPL